jgi:hypothetical protein
MASDSQLAKKETVWAVVRIDDHEGAELEERITLREILPTSEEAETEAARLNALGKARYFVQAGNYFPDGRGVRVSY